MVSKNILLVGGMFLSTGNIGMLPREDVERGEAELLPLYSEVRLGIMMKHISFLTISKL